ncbi:hypothetical protein [Lentimicrobium sp. S6]|uniref:hypothetical protein n=1 Tax=Lentimicrobium sp. S6 TaxID=2735872 RepID=UPI00155413E7|nr:hypothetical protein [Lentimicrobium sp. S6]NPD47697.1 hypothetical protein [Lentimicrobium sp. S6]
MIQEIIVYAILIITFGLTFYKLFGFFDMFKNDSNKSACGSCASSSCGSCSVKIIANNKKILHPLKVDHEKMNG